MNGAPAVGHGGSFHANWDESKHPRVPSGPQGGEFAPKSGSVANDQLALPSSAYPPMNPNGVDTFQQYSDGRGHWTPEREKLHEAIIEKFLAGKQPSRTPTATIMGGGPASGKSAIVDTIADGPTVVKIDVDKIRKMLPEFNEKKGTLAASTTTHEESSWVAKAVRDRAVQRGHDIVFDGVNDGDYEKMRDRAASFRQHGGYAVNAEYVTTTLEEARRREAIRFAKYGRGVPEPFFSDVHAEISRSLPRAMREGLFDNVNLWDTTGPPGTKNHVASSRGKRLTVHDNALWGAFLAKGDVK